MDVKEDNPPPSNLQLGAKHYVGRGAFIDDAGFSSFRRFHETISEAVRKTAVTETCEAPIDLDPALERLRTEFRVASADNGRLIFIGNGGSASIASHLAVDFTKNAGIPAVAFNDVAMLTCLANDYSYEEVFARQLGFYATRRDLVVIISSSGRSPNVLKSAAAARNIGCRMLVTLSGMDPNNLLRTLGDLNFYVPCRDYGLVEIAHLALLHSVVSL